ncbi:uncharacterized protein [Clytia hemisphaerica]|uniref:uncharacterized protein n=1 Tax=Clytia hemisphaerica TaxID=252671 RepID=UPI0034D51FBB
MTKILKILLVLHALIVGVTASAQWGSWSAYGACFSYEYAVRPRKRRTRTCPDETCVGPSSSYKYDCIPSSIFLQVTSVTNQDMRWTGGINTMTLETSLRFRNVHEAINQPFNSTVHSIAMEHLFGKEDARYVMETRSLTRNCLTNLPEQEHISGFHSSEKGQGIQDHQVRHDLLGKFDSNPAVICFKTQQRLMETPESSNIYASVVVKVTQEEIGSAYFVHQKTYRKTASTEHRILTDDQSWRSIYYDFPGAKFQLLGRIDMEGKTEGFTHHIRIVMYFPPQIVITQSITNWYSTSIAADVCRNFMSFAVDEEKRKLIITIPQAIHGRNTDCNPQFTISHAYNEFKRWEKQARYKTFLDTTFCKGNDWACTSMDYGTVTTQSVNNTKSITESQYDFEGGRRIKEKATGRCWALDTTDGRSIILSSSCKEAFHFAPVGSGLMKLIHSPSGKSILGSNNVLKQSLNEGGLDYFGLTKNQTLTLNRDGTAKRFSCLTVNDDGTIRQNIGPFKEDVPMDSACGQLFSFLHAFPQDIMDKISMKSMLKISTSKGSTLFVCTPSKDLMDKSNCYWSVDVGVTWIAMTPKISELKAFIPSEDSFYGLCHSAKYHCKYHVETGLLHYVTLTEYQSKLSDVNMVSATNLDDMQLDTTPQESDDVSIGISSLGLYKAPGGAWSRIFLWQNQPEYVVL